MVCRVGPTCDYMIGTTLNDGANLLAPSSRRCRRALLFLLFYISCIPMIYRRFALGAQSGNKLLANVAHVFLDFIFGGPCFLGRQLAGKFYFKPILSACAQGLAAIFLEIPFRLSQTLRISKGSSQQHHPPYRHLFGPGLQTTKSKIFNFLIKGVVKETAITV